ncbi:MAG: DNA methyltransferase, partial [Boseongicola sp. SB0667_bin_21]|nr:DNA methyltransferase [Boseongicola sp. SB0667_bin_21]
MFQELADLAGNRPSTVTLIGETALTALSTRPDYAVTNRKGLIGFIEIKAPGKGADPRKFTEDHDKKQWRKLKCLPNLLYTDGNAFSVWNNGELSGKVIKLDGDVETSGKSLRAPQDLVGLVASFLSWNPFPPRTAKELAEISARLCRLLRDEVMEELRRDNASLEALAKEWRDLLFPEATDAQFADGYAQAVTFGILMAKARNISLANGIGHA